MLLHLVWILFIILMVAAIIVGKLRGWLWTSNWTLRHVHLLMIVIVVGESWLGIPCPLTVWENEARFLSGEVLEQSFMAKIVHKVVFYNFPEWVFTAVYSVFAAVIIWLYVWAKPRPAPWKR